jgi:hypothetical protein
MYYFVWLNEYQIPDTFASAYSRIKVGCIQVYNVDSFAFDGRVKRVLWGCSEVTAMKVPEQSTGAHVARLVRAVASMRRLRSLKEEQRRAWTFERHVTYRDVMLVAESDQKLTVICFDESHRDAT